MTKGIPDGSKNIEGALQDPLQTRRGWYSSAKALCIEEKGIRNLHEPTVLLTMVGSTITRKNRSMINPNLATFTLLVRSVNQTSIGGTVNTAAQFVITTSNIAREKLPPAIKD